MIFVKIFVYVFALTIKNNFRNVTKVENLPNHNLYYNMSYLLLREFKNKPGFVPSSNKQII